MHQLQEKSWHLKIVLKIHAVVVPKFGNMIIDPILPRIMVELLSGKWSNNENSHFSGRW